MGGIRCANSAGGQRACREETIAALADIRKASLYLVHRNFPRTRRDDPATLACDGWSTPSSAKAPLTCRVARVALRAVNRRERRPESSLSW
jgi:hypothetical protein